jgi:glucosyl-dolichyl phosphate glucuronosyltransferase
MPSPLLSVVLCTWNRAVRLEDALLALGRQTDPPPHEVLVVDNGSSDRTPEVLAAARARMPALRPLHEPRQGLSHARNAGVAAAHGDLVAFTDDDVRVGEGWMRALVAAADRHPDAAFLGGPVRPLWAAAVPGWLTPAHWAPLGIQDYGAEPFRVDRERRVCLIGANLCVRRAALAAIGPFDPLVQRVGEAGGTTEDHDLQARFWEAGSFGMYVPEVEVRAIVGPERLRKAYHRAWRFGHGRHVARMRLPEIEASGRRLLGVPGHVLRQGARDARGLLRALVRGGSDAFEYEARLWYTAGFLRERWS